MKLVSFPTSIGMVHLRKESAVKSIQQPAPQKREIKLHTRQPRASTYVGEMHTFVWPDILQSTLASLYADTHTPYNPRGQLSQGEIEREIG